MRKAKSRWAHTVSYEVASERSIYGAFVLLLSVLLLSITSFVDTMGTGSFLAAKLPGCGFNHPSPPSAEVKVKVELYLYSSSGPSWPVPR